MTHYSLLKPYILSRDRYCCSYCGRRYNAGKLGIDHFYPRIKYPELANDLENMVLSCAECNAIKGGIDPTNLIFNPRSGNYSDHVERLSTGYLSGKTPLGKSTIHTLKLNRPNLVSWRHSELLNSVSLREILVALSKMDDADKFIDGFGSYESEYALDLYRRLEDLTRVPFVSDDEGKIAETKIMDWTTIGKELTPYVMAYFKKNPTELQAVDPYLFERIIAEYFASIGCNVKLLGQNPKTGADILAVRTDDPVGVDIRYLIEVKRTKQKVGIQAIDRVLGTFSREKPERGWDKTIIVSRSGFTNFHATSRDKLDKLGMHLKGTEDIIQYLQSYKPRPDGGLWLPYGWDCGLNC